MSLFIFFFFFQAEDGIRDLTVTGVQTCALPISHKIEKAESQIDWRQDAEAIARRLRAFNPFPGGATQYGDESIKVWEAHADPAIAVGTAAPGTVLSAGADGVRVACGNGVLCMTLLQRAGGKRLAAGDFLRGFDLDRKSTRLNSSHSQIS